MGSDKGAYKGAGARSQGFFFPKCQNKSPPPSIDSVVVVAFHTRFGGGGVSIQPYVQNPWCTYQTLTTYMYIFFFFCMTVVWYKFVFMRLRFPSLLVNSLNICTILVHIYTTCTFVHSHIRTDLQSHTFERGGPSAQTQFLVDIYHGSNL